jgi:hypothetical protein
MSEILLAWRASCDTGYVQICTAFFKKGKGSFLFYVFIIMLQIERLAWDMVKFQYNKHITDRKLIFRLFCLFNRFCDPDQLPLRLPGKAGAYLLYNLGMNLKSLPEAGWTLDTFLGAVNEDNNDECVLLVDRLYNKVVRSVILQDRVRFRVIKDTGYTATWKSLTASPALPKTIVINHRFLTIYDNDIADLDNIGYIQQEPLGKVLHKVPLVGSETRTRKPNGLFNKASSNLIINAGCGKTSIELTFNAVKDNNLIFKWSEAVQLANELIDECSDPLTKIYKAHNLRPSYFKFIEQRQRECHAGFKKSIKATNSAMNMRSECSSEEQSSAYMAVPASDHRRQSAPDLAERLATDVNSFRDDVIRLRVPHRHLVYEDSWSDSGVSCNDDDSNYATSNKKYGVVIHLDGVNGHKILTKSREENNM